MPPICTWLNALHGIHLRFGQCFAFDWQLSFRLWNGASIRSTIDGGTDRWLEFVKTEAIDASPKFPDIVSGDFDSIQQSTLALCKENGSEVVPTPDQDFTDFEKGLRALTARCNLQLDSIVVIAELGGRIDQTISCLNTLRIGVELPGSPRIYLLSRWGWFPIFAMKIVQKITLLYGALVVR